MVLSIAGNDWKFLLELEQMLEADCHPSDKKYGEMRDRLKLLNDNLADQNKKKQAKMRDYMAKKRLAIPKYGYPKRERKRKDETEESAKSTAIRLWNSRVNEK